MLNVLDVLRASGGCLLPYENFSSVVHLHKGY